MKAMRIRLADENGRVYHWTIVRVPRAINYTLGLSRVVTGWQFTDHDSYTRFVEGNWIALVPAVKATAQNYGFSLLSELS